MGSLQSLEGNFEVGGIGNNTAISEHEDAAGVASHIEIVRDKNHGDFLLFVELLKEFDDFAAGA